MTRFAQWIVARALKRKPDFQVGGAADPYMNRWWLIPRNPIFNIYLHQFIRDDDDRALHDHPWPSFSLLLCGELVEYTFDPDSYAGGRRFFQREDIREGQWTFRSPRFAHMLKVPTYARGKTWTLFITGPRIRPWGFHCPKGWVHWQDFTAGDHGEIVGKGCGE